MVLSDLSIQRPVMAFVLSAILMVFGYLGYEQLPVRELPRIDPPVVSVDTSYPGASAEVVDNEITERIESVVNGIEGIRTIRSRSSDGNSSVSIEFDLSRDIDSAANDVRERVSRVIDNLPEEADPPETSKVDSDSQPIMWITMNSDRMTQMELTDYVRRYLLDTLNTTPGVARVRMGGSREFSMRIWLDRDQMAARSVTVQDVSRAIQRENTELPAGRIESAAREFTVRTDTRLSRPEEFRRIVVFQDGENVVRLGDVARVEVGPRDERGDFRVNGVSAVSMGIIRQSTANTVEVSQAVRVQLAAFEKTLPQGTSLAIRHDDSLFISQSIYEVFHAIGTAILLVILVVWIFLRTVRATIIPVVAIPVSLVAAFGVLALMGYSVNVLTLLAFVLAVGLVVDDAIIVVENVARRIEEGEPPLLAAFRGSRQIGFAVIATTLVLIAVILPLAMLDNEQGRLLREFAVALMAAVGFSSVVALTLSPMLCSKLLTRHNENSRFFRVTERVFVGMSNLYGRVLDWSLRVPLVMAALFAAVVGATWLMFAQLPQELAPQEDRGVFRISVTAPEGASIDYTMRELKAVEGILQPLIERGEIAVLSILNPGWGGAGGVNRAVVIVRTPPWDQRTRSIQEILAEVRGKLQTVPGARVNSVMPSGLGLRGGGSNQLQVVLRGNTFEELAEWRDALIEQMQDYPGLTGWQADYDETKPQLRIQVDRERAASLGVSVTDIGTTLEAMMAERRVTRYLDRGEEYDVVLQAEADDRATSRDLSNIYLRGSRSDQLIPLANLITVTDRAGPTELNRYNRLRAITLTANLAEGTAMGEAMQVVQQAVNERLPPEAQISFEGAARQQVEAADSIFFALIMALLIAFLVLAAQFENFRLPLIILLAVPPALFGGILAIVGTGMSFNIYTQIGLILLIGLICKNAILIVEFANQLRDEGMDLHNATIEAAKLRLRPILMTSIATVFGAVPLALAYGPGAEARSAIGWVIVGGVSVGTLLALFVTPILYRFFAHGVKPIGLIQRQIVELDHKHKEAPPQVPAE
ncbi:MAG: hypothetical protein RLY86_1408 [Pseudomonadota bacterium]|jgi:multidrug efflux pump